MKYLLIALITVLSACSNNNENSKTTDFSDDRSDCVLDISKIENVGSLSLNTNNSLIDFGSAESSTRTINIKNESAVAAAFSLDALTTNSGFVIKTNRCSSPLAAKTSCLLTIAYSSRGLYNGNPTDYLSISTPTAGTPLLIQLKATIENKPDPNTADPSLAYTLSATSTGKSLTVKNNGPGNANDISIVPPIGYVISTNRCGVILKPQQSCIVNLFFNNYRQSAPTSGNISIVASGHEGPMTPKLIDVLTGLPSGVTATAGPLPFKIVKLANLLNFGNPILDLKSPVNNKYAEVDSEFDFDTFEFHPKLYIVDENSRQDITPSQGLCEIKLSDSYLGNLLVNTNDCSGNYRLYFYDGSNLSMITSAGNASIQDSDSKITQFGSKVYYQMADTSGFFISSVDMSNGVYTKYGNYSTAAKANANGVSLLLIYDGDNGYQKGFLSIKPSGASRIYPDLGGHTLSSDLYNSRVSYSDTAVLAGAFEDVSSDRVYFALNKDSSEIKILSGMQNSMKFMSGIGGSKFIYTANYHDMLMVDISTTPVTKSQIYTGSPNYSLSNMYQVNGDLYWEEDSDDGSGAKLSVINSSGVLKTASIALNQFGYNTNLFVYDSKIYLNMMDSTGPNIFLVSPGATNPLTLTPITDAASKTTMQKFVNMQSNSGSDFMGITYDQFGNQIVEKVVPLQ